MNKLETKEAIKILLSEKKKAGYKLEKAYDGYCLLPNEHDQEDWDNYSALVAALEMAVEALEKQIPKKLIAKGDGYADGSMVYDSFYCPSCDHRMEEDEVEDYCPNCGQKICWE